MGAVRKQQDVSRRTDLDWRLATAQKNFAGFIFFCNSSTRPDLDRYIFGLPAKYEDTVRCIRKGMTLFLFNYSNRCLYGVFEAASDGGFNIDPYAWEYTDLTRGRYGHPISRYPAQVRVRIRENRPRLDEELFRPILDHVDGSRFKLDLTAHQVQQLLHLFDASTSLEKQRPNKGLNRPIPAMGYRDPESPRSTYKSDSDYYSDSSSRGMNSGDDDWPDETLCDKVQYHQEDEEGQIRERLSQVSLNDYRSYDNGHYEIPATLEDELSACGYNDEDTAWKESFQEDLHCSGYDCQVALRLHENDPAVSSNSLNGMQNGVDHPVLVNNLDNVLPTPILPSQMQFPFAGNVNMIWIPVQTVQCQQGEKTPYSGESESTKWNSQRRSSRASPSNPPQRIFIHHGPKDERYQKHQMVSDTQQSARIQPQKLQSNPVLVPFCTQGPGQVGDQGHVATVMSPMFIPSARAADFAQQQTGGRTDESGKGFDAVDDGQILREGWQQSLQSGQGQIVLVPSVVPSLVDAITVIHFEILQFARWTRPSSKIQLHVEAAIYCVRRGVKMVWPEADVEVFGSFATGLCLQHSDVDLAVIDAPCVPGSENLTIAQVSATLIRELAAGLKTCEWCESINSLDTASMPVLKCLCTPFGTSLSTTPAIAVDITIGGTTNSYSSRPTAQGIETADQAPRLGKFITRHTGGAAREYVLQKIQELHALAPLVLLLKSFLHHKGLSNVYAGGLDSFSLTLLVAFYLERTSDLPTSPIAPPSCSEFSDDSDAASAFGSHSLGEFYVRRAANTVESVLSFWDRMGPAQLGSFLIGFLYSFVSLDLSCKKIVLKGTDGSPGGLDNRDDRHVALWIDDPLHPGVNIAAGSFCMVHVQTALREMLEVLSHPDAILSLQCEDKNCQDLAAMGASSYFRRLVVEAEEFQ